MNQQAESREALLRQTLSRVLGNRFVTTPPGGGSEGKAATSPSVAPRSGEQHCPYCERTFSSQTTFNRHLRDRRSGEPQSIEDCYSDYELICHASLVQRADGVWEGKNLSSDAARIYAEDLYRDLA